MAATLQVELNIGINGLNKPITGQDVWIDSVAPTKGKHDESLTQTAVDTPQALYVGDIATIKGLWIRAIENEVLIDTSFDTTFSGEVVIPEGRSVFIIPTGTVYFRATEDDELATIEYVVAGI